MAATWATSQSRACCLGRAYRGWVQAAGTAAQPDTQRRPGQWAPGLAGRPEWLQTQSDQREKRLCGLEQEGAPTPPEVPWPWVVSLT